MLGWEILVKMGQKILHKKTQKNGFMGKKIGLY
jgi:hypothetical protein